MNEQIKTSFKHLNQTYYIDSFDIRTVTITVPSFTRDIIGHIFFRFETLEDQYEGNNKSKIY
jgi:hypothetical protein